MARITVLRPDVGDEGNAPRVELAPRAPVDGGLITVVENSKPNAGLLLSKVAERLRGRYGMDAVEVFTKPSAAYPIDVDVAKGLAARSRLVITGVGD